MRKTVRNMAALLCVAALMASFLFYQGIIQINNSWIDCTRLRAWMFHSLPGYDIWIRSVYSVPPDGAAWTFWQYSNRMKLDGYSGEERIRINQLHQRSSCSKSQNNSE